MSDDFVRLVSQANPANNQYQQTSNGYPPKPSRDQQLDPFFDDEDDDGPDSAFGRPSPMPMQSQTSGIHLTKNAAPPAGVAQPWSFDDEDPQQTYPGSTLPSSSSSTLQERKKRRIPQIKWEWPWKKKEQVLAGERTVVLNNPSANEEFCSNYITTSKYNVATFLPKFLLGACSRFLSAKLVSNVR